MATIVPAPKSGHENPLPCLTAKQRHTDNKKIPHHNVIRDLCILMKNTLYFSKPIR